jgi:hypothetical protein
MMRDVRIPTSAFPHWTDWEIGQAALCRAQKARTAALEAVDLERIERLETFAGMVLDKGWTLPGSVRAHALTALLHCLAPAEPAREPRPEIGFPGGLIVIDRLVHELRHEVRAYREFQLFRERESLRQARAGQPLEVRLNLKRKQLRARIQAKAMRRAERARLARGSSLWRRLTDRKRVEAEIPLPSACAWALSRTP